MSDNKILVAVPDFATLDEILAGLSLTGLLQKSQKDVRLYLGQQNISKKLQLLLPQLSDVKIYEPNHQPNELIINIPISDNKVNKVKWEQEDSDLKIHIETTKNLEKSPPINVKGKINFSKLFLINASSIEEVYNGELVNAHSDFSNCEVIKLLDQESQKKTETNQPQKGENSVKIIQDRNFPSVSELLCKFLEEENFDFQSMPENIAKLLVTGAKQARIARNRSLKNLVGPLKQIPYRKTIFFKLTEKEFKLVNHFWSQDKPDRTLSLNDFEVLLKITPQLNIFNFLTTKYLADKKITRKFATDRNNEGLTITNNFELRKSLNSKNTLNSRRFSKYEIIRQRPIKPIRPQKKPKAPKTPKAPKKSEKTDIFQEI
jgi:hypothetical protein